MAVLAQKHSTVRRFVEDTGLPFHILVDETREVTKRYGVWHRLGVDAWNIARPALFAIDASGIVRAVYVSESQAEFPTPAQVDEAIAKLGSG